MPPSSQYLHLLNLNQVEDSSQQQIDFTNEDIAKDLELFTNTNFLDFEPFYPQSTESNPFNNNMLDLPGQQQALTFHDDKAKYSTNGTPPRNQMPQFQPASEFSSPVTDVNHQSEQKFESHSRKRSAESAGHDQTATPSSASQIDEEDKRRRNTAASARFRVKKKQREQALLESAKQMTDKNTLLENRIKELEMENKWLRSLLKPVNVEQTKNVLSSLS